MSEIETETGKRKMASCIGCDRGCIVVITVDEQPTKCVYGIKNDVHWGLVHNDIDVPTTIVMDGPDIEWKGGGCE